MNDGCAKVAAVQGVVKPSRFVGTWWSGHVCWSPGCENDSLTHPFVPYYFGYVPFTFTSAFPVGGVIYSHVLHLASIPFWLIGFDRTYVDTLLLDNLPKVLEPLSQLPGPMMSLSGGGPAGPVAVGVLGILLGLALLATCRALRRLRMLGSGSSR